jgi:GAF domain-containing protein
VAGRAAGSAVSGGAGGVRGSGDGAVRAAGGWHAGVPVALVWLAEAGREVFAGQVGLAELRASGGQAPLAGSLCQRVAAAGCPVVLAGVRQDEQARGGAAISDLGVIACAGMPLTDSAGGVLGSLCAIDTRPRGPGCGMLRGAEAPDRLAPCRGCRGRGRAIAGCRR